MTTFLISNCITFACALAGFIYGLVKYMKVTTPLFAKMVTMTSGCMAVGGLYQIIRLWIGSDITEEFQLGYLAFIGSLLFLISASYGCLNKAVDSKSKKLGKHRWLALIAPVAIAAAYAVIAALFTVSTLNKVTGSLVSVLAMLLSYVSMKHLIMPADDTGLLKALKPYNILTLLYSVCCVAQMVVITSGNGIAALIVAIVVGVILLLLTPSVKKGVEIWKI